MDVVNRLLSFRLRGEGKSFGFEFEFEFLLGGFLDSSFYRECFIFRVVDLVCSGCLCLWWSWEFYC